MNRPLISLGNVLSMSVKKTRWDKGTVEERVVTSIEFIGTDGSGISVLLSSQIEPCVQVSDMTDRISAAFEVQA